MNTIAAIPVYMRDAFGDLDLVADRLAMDVDPNSYDTIVTRGLSGALVVPWLARKLGKGFLIVRKDNDGTHDWRKVAGILGRRWLFVDDFVDTGQTFYACQRVVDQFAASEAFDTTCVGVYEYQKQRFSPAEPTSAPADLLIESDAPEEEGDFDEGWTCNDPTCTTCY